MSPWELHRKTGSSDKTNRILDTAPLRITSHQKWRKLTHNTQGLLVLKLLRPDLDLHEAVRHIIIDQAIPFKQRKLLAQLTRNRRR